MGLIKKGYGAVTTVLVTTSLTVTVNKLTFNELPPYIYLTLRYFGIIVLTLLLSKKIDKETEGTFKRDIAIIKSTGAVRGKLTLTILVYLLAILMYYKVFNYMPVSLISVMDLGIQLMVVTSIGVLFLKEKIQNKAWFYIGTTLIGMMFIFLGGNNTGEIQLIGVLILLVSATATAIDMILTKQIIESISVNTVMILKIGVCTISLLLMSIYNSEPIYATITGLNLYTIGLILFTVVTGYLGRIMVTISTVNIGTTTTSLFLAFTPIVSTIIATLVFKEGLTVVQWVGVLVTAVSLIMCNKEK